MNKKKKLKKRTKLKIILIFLLESLRLQNAIAQDIPKQIEDTPAFVRKIKNPFEDTCSFKPDVEEIPKVVSTYSPIDQMLKRFFVTLSRTLEKEKADKFFEITEPEELEIFA